MNRVSEDIFISRGHLPWWKLTLPLASFGMAVYCVYRSFEIVSSEEGAEVTQSVLGLWFVALWLSVIAIVFAKVKDVHFDFQKKRYKEVKRVGLIGFGRWKPFHKLEYVSLFRNLSLNYEINLWYNGTEHFAIDIFWDKEEALETARELARKLNLPFHDALVEKRYDVAAEVEVDIPKGPRNVDVHISQGVRPLWQSIVAAILLTAAFVVLFFFFKTFEFDVKGKRLVAYLELIEVAAILFIAGLGFAVVSDYQFDFDNNQFKHIYRVGPFKYGLWQRYRSLDYLSVFQERKGVFHLNFWYNTNKRLPVAGYTNKDTAMEMGKHLAEKLNIKVWDATDPHNAKWAN